MMDIEEFHVFIEHNIGSSSFPVFDQLRQEGILCDVKLKVDTRTFLAHRVVLAGNYERRLD